MNKPVVSIIIITRNRPFLLGHCLERVCSQASVETRLIASGRDVSPLPIGTSYDESGSYSASDSGVGLWNLEIIVVDSSSNDESEHVVMRYPGTKYLRVHGERNNMPQARNRGIACSTGEIIAFIDDDSMVQP